MLTDSPPFARDVRLLPLGKVDPNLTCMIDTIARLGQQVSS